ncbi:MAG: cupredoxin domain-containing protein [Deltaproteobacteria bacterium]|nr:cupredoxin domain-containing protein [Deltaproteobacteria bacterium]
MRASFVVAAALALLACEKKDADKAAEKPAVSTPAPAVKTAAPAGPRTVPIEANDKGYVPDKITGKANEKLKLVFTRTIDAECLAELKTPDGKLHKLEMNKPLEVEVTVPATGKLAFACGMDMFQGHIVADVN